MEQRTFAPAPVPPAGAADVRYGRAGGVLATLPVVVGGADGGTLRAVYPPGAGPGPDELAFLLSIADHAGTALHAAELIERASARAGYRTARISATSTSTTAHRATVWV